MRSPLRILHLEDDPKDAELIHAVLEAEDIFSEVTRVDTQADFVAALDRGDLDLVLADYTLPSFDGVSALRISLEKCPDIPFIFVSGTLGEEVAIEALKIGATDYLIKDRPARMGPSVRRALREVKERAARKSADEALRRSEAYLSEAQRLSNTGSFGWKASTGEIIWSEETYRIFGWEPTTIPTVELISRQTHPEDAAFVDQTLERVSLNHEDFDIEHRLLMPDGSVKNVRVVGHAVNDELGGIEFVGAVMDVTEQHQAKAALERAFNEIKKSEDHLRTVINTIPALVWSGLPDGTLDFVNQPWLTYLGWSPDELFVRGGLWSVVHPDDIAGSEKTWSTALATGKHNDREFRVRRGDGVYRWFLSRAMPLRDGEGNIVRWYGTASDIEDRKRASELLAGEKRLLEMVARSESLPSILDALCRLVEASTDGALSSILLLEPNTNKLRHGAAPSLPTEYSEAIDGFVIGPSRGSCGTAAYRGAPVIVSDIASDPLWVEFRDLALGHGLRACWSTPILSSAGKVLGTFAIYYREPRSPLLHDSNVIEQVTHLASIAIERAQATQALQQQANLLEQAHDAIFVWELSGTIVYWNRGAEQLYGFSKKEAIGRPSHDLIHTEHPTARQKFEAALERDGEWTGELIQTTRDGRKIIVESRHVLMQETDGRRLVLETNRDITDRKRSAESLRQAQEHLAYVSRVTTMGELTASLAHEVNQPITAAVTNANTCLRWLSRDVPNLQEARAAAARIVQDGTRAADIIQRIRHLFQKGSPIREWVDVGEVIREIIVLLQNEATRHSVSIRTELGEEVPRLVADRVQLQQVMMNLILNGIDAVKDVTGERELIIRTRRTQDKHLVVSVTDNGVGLPSERTDEIFNAFFTTKPHGTGLGLSIGRTIVEAHGGKLWAIQNDSKGATIQFSLPLNSENRAAKILSPRDAPTEKGVRKKEAL